MELNVDYSDVCFQELLMLYEDLQHVSVTKIDISYLIAKYVAKFLGEVIVNKSITN